MNTLTNWDYHAEQEKAEFLDVLYDYAGRTNGLYTGLWQEFCIGEAGPMVRNMYFERQLAVRRIEEEINAQELALQKGAAFAESQEPISDI